MKALPRSRIDRVLATSPETPVRIYTLQAEPSWDRAQRIGYLAGDAAHVESGYRRHASAWMHERMAERLSGHSGDYPIWAWLKRPSAKLPPYSEAREARIRVTAIVPRGRMLLSDFDAWHSVLNESYHCETEAEWQVHDARWPRQPHRGEPDFARYLFEVEPSWHRVFDLLDNRAEAVTEWLGCRRRLVLQACVDRIHLEEIVSVRRFVR